jgi:hypothetical protein
MERGFIPDLAPGGQRLVPRWMRGAAKKSFWMGTKEPLTHSIPIAAFRCESCGYVETCARLEFEAE